MEKITASRNIGLFIDYENVYKSLLPSFRNVIRDGFFEKIRNWCQDSGGRIVKLAVYCNYDNEDLHTSFHQSLLQSYGVEAIHTSNQGKNYADIQICIDVLNTMYLNSNIDEFIIMSNDKDMTPLLNTIRTNKRNVTVITVGSNFNNTILMFADDHIRYEDVVQSGTDIPLIIKDLEQRVWDSTNQFLTGKCTTWLSGRQIPTYSVEYFLQSQSQNFKIMNYELANMLRIFHAQGLVAFHKYTYMQKIYEAFIPKPMLQGFLDAGIMAENMLLPGYDVNALVEQQYLKFAPRA